MIPPIGSTEILLMLRVLVVPLVVIALVLYFRFGDEVMSKSLARLTEVGTISNSSKGAQLE